MRASILLVARDNPAALWAQIEALVECDLAEDVEVVVVDDASAPETRALLARLEGDVSIHRSDRPVGRRAALARRRQGGAGRRLHRARLCVPPAARFRRPAGRGGAGRSGARRAGDRDRRRGRATATASADDGSLWPLARGSGSAGCARAGLPGGPRQWWIERQPLAAAREGHQEVLVAQAVDRLAVGVRRARRPRVPGRSRERDRLYPRPAG